MILIIRRKATQEEIRRMSENSGGDIKIVVDIERKILAGGGERHLDAQQILTGNGSSAQNLWGGEFNLVTKQIDYASILNLRPPANFTREITSFEIRKKFDKIVKDLLF